jgi:predicted small secreted protein
MRPAALVLLVAAALVLAACAGFNPGCAGARGC